MKAQYVIGIVELVIAAGLMQLKVPKLELVALCAKTLYRMSFHVNFHFQPLSGC